jgi:LPXTG-motif cell wall-anchored protein
MYPTLDGLTLVLAGIPAVLAGGVLVIARRRWSARSG